MKTLCIIRHAKTEVQAMGQRDFDRELAKRGLSDAPQMAKKLKEIDLMPDKIVSSPAARALATAQLFADKLKYPLTKIEQNSLIYAAALGSLIKVVKELSDDDKTVFLFGHNPGLTLLANYLCTSPILHLPTSGIVCIDFDTKHWSSITTFSGKQRFFVHP